MTDDNSGAGLSSDIVFVDFGEKVRRGYDPETVDRHLEALAASMKALRHEVDSAGHIDDESLYLMMSAGRRSVEEALAEARARVEVMLADAERDSERRLADAESKADEICSAAEVRAQEQEENIEIRLIEVTALNEEIELRQSALRTAAAELLQLADRFIDDPVIDLRESDAAGSTDADESFIT